MRVASEERVFSLILALVTSPIGFTKQQLLSSVHGYADDYRGRVKQETLERRFERDKQHIRELGIPLEVVDSPLEPGNTQLARYRIQKAILQIPDSVRFTEPELRMLTAAALVWQEGSLSVDSRRALMKLTSIAETIDPAQLSITPIMSINEPAVYKVREALASGKTLAFGYRKAGDTRTTKREVSPLRLHRADGRWHLIAFDHLRENYRTFLLSRIIDEPSMLPEGVDEALYEGAEQVVEALTERETSQLVTLEVARGSYAEGALRPRALRVDSMVTQTEPTTNARVTLELTTLDYAALAEELLLFGQDVRVISPDIVNAHIGRLAGEIVTRHRDAAVKS